MKSDGEVASCHIHVSWRWWSNTWKSEAVAILCRCSGLLCWSTLSLECTALICLAIPCIYIHSFWSCSDWVWQEICIGILGNLACHSKAEKAMVTAEGFVSTALQQLQFDDPPILSETCRWKIVRYHLKFHVLDLCWKHIVLMMMIERMRKAWTYWAFPHRRTQVIKFYIIDLYASTRSSDNVVLKIIHNCMFYLVKLVEHYDFFILCI